MEKVKSGTIEATHTKRCVRLPKKEVSVAQHRWVFTEQEKAIIKRILKKHASEKDITVFIMRLEYLCDVKKNMLGQPKRMSTREWRSHVLEDFKAVLRHLKEIERDEMIVNRDETVDQYEGLTPMEWHSPLYMHDIIQPIEEYVRFIEEIPDVKRTGRDPANFDHFIGRVAGLYTEHIGTPTNYVDGPFFELWKALLIILGMPPRDWPEKTIRAALK